MYLGQAAFLYIFPTFGAYVWEELAELDEEKSSSSFSSFSYFVIFSFSQPVRSARERECNSREGEGPLPKEYDGNEGERNETKIIEQARTKHASGKVLAFSERGSREFASDLPCG